MKPSHVIHMHWWLFENNLVHIGIFVFVHNAHQQIIRHRIEWLGPEIPSDLGATSPPGSSLCPPSPTN